MKLATFTGDYSSAKRIAMWLLSHDVWFMSTPNLDTLQTEIAVSEKYGMWARQISSDMEGDIVEAERNL